MNESKEREAGNEPSDIWTVLKDYIDGWDGARGKEDDPVLHGTLRLSHLEAAADRISELEGRLSMYEGGDDEESDDV